MANDNVAGVAQGVIANVATSVVCAAAALFGLIHTRDIGDPQNWPVWVILLVVFSGLGFAGTSANAARLWWKRHNIPAGPGDCFTVILADLVGDAPSRILKHNVRDALKYFFGSSIQIITYPMTFAIGEGRDDIEVRKTHAQAQNLLSKKRGDILIWGRVKSASGIALHFTRRSGTTTEVITYPLETGLELPADFNLDVGAAIAERIFDIECAVVAMTYARDEDAIVPYAKRFAQKLMPLVAHPKASWTPSVRGAVFHGFASAMVLSSRDGADLKSLEEAVGAYRQTLQEWSREEVPFYWAMAKHNLAGALRKLASLQNDPTLLEQALGLYRDTLEEWTFETAPYHWATAQKNLASLLRDLAVRTMDQERLEEALAACRLALTVITREELPLRWASIQVELSHLFEAFAGQKGELAHLEEAIAALRETLTVISRRQHPLGWASIQEMLGRLLWFVGERKSDTKRLNEAAVAHRLALKERTRRRVPIAWALSQGNLGNAWQSLGARELEQAQRQQAEAGNRKSHNAAQRKSRLALTHLLWAAVAQCNALEEITRERLPLDWAMLMNNLSDTWRQIDQWQPGSRVELAIWAAREALEERTRERVPLDWARTQGNLGNALLLFSRLPDSGVQPDEAVIAYQAALQELTRERVPFEWAISQFNLGNALRYLGSQREDIGILEEAIGAYSLALQELTENSAPQRHRIVSEFLAEVVAEIEALRSVGPRAMTLAL